MKKQMTLAQALKEKSRILAKLTETRNHAISFNAVDVGSERPVDMAETMEMESTLSENLVRVKAAITQGNAPIARQLALMMSIRSSIQFLQQLDTVDVRTVSRPNGDVKIARDVHVTAKGVLERVDALQRQLENLQDEVDDFNALHRRTCILTATPRECR